MDDFLKNESEVKSKKIIDENLFRPSIKQFIDKCGSI